MRRRHRLMVMTGVAVAAALAAGAALALEGRVASSLPPLVLTPVADTYVRADQPARAFGTARSLVVAGRPAATAFLRFRVAVPDGRTVARARLQLFAASRSPAGFTVRAVPSTTWGERTTTYATAPRISRAPSVASGPHRGSTYVSVDVTSLVSRGGLVSLAVVGAPSTRVTFRSREAAKGRPRLLVDTAPSATVASGPCGTAAKPPQRVDHVIWIWMENKPYGAIIGSPSAPYTNELASGCGLATSYHGVTHPSLPNYIAATSGGTQGVTDDAPASAHPLHAESIFSQVRASGREWRSYQESSPGTCPQDSSGRYASKHDPAAYYVGIRSDCARWDVPLGTPESGALADALNSGTLPAFAFVTPDLCNDTHDCPVSTGDSWLKTWIPKILDSAAYRSGRTVVFITWDEDDGSAANHIPLLALSPSIRPGTQVGATLDHYALLRTTEELLGLTPFLGHAGDPGTGSMASAFNLR